MFHQVVTPPSPLTESGQCSPWIHQMDRHVGNCVSRPCPENETEIIFTLQHKLPLLDGEASAPAEFADT